MCKIKKHMPGTCVQVIDKEWFDREMNTFLTNQIHVKILINDIDEMDHQIGILTII
ncbi:hypothetical protein PghCCS26_41660 [Paenibacillus glycanilyticus]|uniref:Uncharacterized protein n=1 Tax=Paenibacillus glycanilyticus TaxID=126569 RepID=A0ABQ6NPL0_9BACL|nr:hypothetical protein PghCCS26_41660 [Paenibacillus glycanilyticus]